MNSLKRSSSLQHVAALVDQGVSSLSNVFFTLAAAHVLTRSDFGRVSLLIGACIIILGLQRAFVTDPYMIGAGEPGSHGGLSTFGSLAGAGVIVSLISMPALVLSGAGGSSEVFWVSLTLGLGLPGLCVADALRMTYFRKGLAEKALALDTIWIVFQVAFAVVSVMNNRATGICMALSWVGGAAVASLFALVRERVWISFASGIRWTLRQKRLGGPMAVDFLSGQGAAQLSLVAVAAVAGSTEVADIKLVQLALGPLLVVIQGLRNSSLPLLAKSTADQRWRLIHVLGGLFALVGTIVTLALLWCPVSITERIFGEVWSHQAAIIVLVGLQFVVAAYTLPHSWLLQLHRDVSAPALARTANGIATVLLAAVLGFRWSSVGAASGMLATSVGMSLYLYLRARRSRDHAPDYSSRQGS
jgi:O-antigen/teichoic acid export membrane protein